MEEFLDIIRREAQHVAGGQDSKWTIVTTSYDPEKHAIKGIIMPHEVESGWIPISSVHSGNGFGILAGPKVGSAEDLKGDQFDLHFENGDQSTPIAKMKHFSETDKPPKVESGEILIQHENGNKIAFAKDKTISITHGSGSGVTFDASGHVTINGGGQGNLT